MAVNFVPVQCPSCGGEMMVDDTSNKVYCSYCRKKFIIHNDNEHINKNYNYNTNVNEDRTEMKKTEAELEKYKIEQISGAIVTIGIFVCLVLMFFALLLFSP